MIKEIRYALNEEDSFSVSPSEYDDKDATKLETEGTRKENAQSLHKDNSGNIGERNARSARKTSSRGRNFVLDLSQIIVPSGYPDAVKSILEELATVNVRRFPNATYLLIRASMEKMIKAYAECNNETITPRDKSSNGRVQLNASMLWLEDYLKGKKRNDMLQIVQRVRSGRLVNYASTKEALDAVNHNHRYEPTPEEAFGFWKTVEPIMRYLSEENDV